jgi:hypothetical protein
MAGVFELSEGGDGLVGVGRELGKLIIIRVFFNWLIL